MEGNKLERGKKEALRWGAYRRVGRFLARPTPEDSSSRSNAKNGCFASIPPPPPPFLSSSLSWRSRLPSPFVSRISLVIWTPKKVATYQTE